MNNVRISGAQGNPRSESDINVNFNDGSQIIAASNAINDANQAQFYSTDGGATWNQTTLPLNAGDDLHSDPAVGWTSDGTAWAIAIGLDAGQTHLRLRAFKSTDSGATWTYDADASGTQTATDKELMCVDRNPASAFNDNIYVIWHNGAPVFVNHRTGPGGSWQTPVQVSKAETTGTGIGGDIATNSSGDVFAFWHDTGSSMAFIAKSTDGGVTFGNPILIANTILSFQIAIPSFVSRSPHILMTGAAYKTATKDLVYAIWMDLDSAGAEPGSNVNSASKSRIWFARSTDGGNTWEAAKMLNNQISKNDQFNPRLALDENNGQLVVMYYDTVADSGRLKSDVWLQTSDDDGVTWSAAVKVSTAQTDESTSSADGNQYGDYNGLSGLNGNFFPCWTDRRSGSVEEIWTVPVRTAKDSFFIIQRSTFGEDEVNGLLLQSPGAAFVPDAFWVVVEGFSAADLGINAGNQGNPPVKPIIAFSPHVSGMTAHCTGVVPEDTSLPAAFQRFRFAFEIVFTDSSGFAFTGTEIVTLTSSLTALGVTLISSGQIELIKQANPYITNGATSWLSIDLRVFQIKSGDSKFGEPMTGSDAPTFIQNVMNRLTTGGGIAGGQSFEFNLPTNEDTSAIQLSPTDADGNAVYNFALARVRLTGVSTVAQSVRVFFRLFQASSTATYFDTNTTYRRSSDGISGGHTIPLAGIQNNEYVTIPCFAEARIDSSSISMATQNDNSNKKDITPNAGGAEVDTFFGCWLDTNQPTIKVLPITPPSGGDPDGNFGGMALESVQDVITRSGHQCLVAEIAFDQFTIPNNADPSTSDKLAQRNLAFGPAPNPGVDISRRVPQTFEIKASTPLMLEAGFEGDELMIDWRHFPRGSTAQIYLPATDAKKILELANKRYNLHNLSLTDNFTLQCKADSITYLPIPVGADINFAGLLTVDLPPTVKKGQRYNVIVRQITTAIGQGKPSYSKPPQVGANISVVDKRGFINWRRVFGAFEIVIPISTKELLLNREEHFYSILRWIQTKIPATSRWYPVFLRYVSQIGGRVTGFGGDPNEIKPSPYGIWHKPKHPHQPGHEAGEERISFGGKVSGLIYDHFGDFEGFYLETEDGERFFKSREHEVENLAQLAWKERIFVNVLAERHALHTPVSIVLRRAPRPFQN